jgi:uncharacterized protein (DUF2267 family)
MRDECDRTGSVRQDRANDQHMAERDRGQIGPDRHRCYQALRAVLFTLRDRLTPDEAAHLASQLPMLVRGIYYEGYRPAGKPDRIRSRDQFLQRIGEHLEQTRPLGADEAARAVFKILDHYLDPGEIADVKQSLPQDIRMLFPVH